MVLPRNVSASTLEVLDSSTKDWSSLQEYVEWHGGNKIISRILIANNGIAAVKCMQSLRKWQYAELGIGDALCFVCMATPEDLAANAEFIRMADEIVEVPKGSNNNNYANVDLIVDIAQRKEVDAVWAGWGHASENPRLPGSLAKDKRGVVFLGPGAKAMYALGDKIGSTIVAQSAGVPCIEWSGTGLNMASLLAMGESDVPAEIYDRACVHNVEEALEMGEKVGYPLMVKASEGGGGKGIRKVTSREEIKDAFLQVQAEVVGSPIFLMRLFSGGRHIEVQVLADQHGEVITLHGRDCSIQRRHQKIIEEGPPVAADPNAFMEMERAAASLAKAVGYVGVGTVEYLYRDGQFFFLEMNPRLQVEHTVTEMINDINLPLAMLLVGMGIPLHRIPDVRTLYNAPDRHGTSCIDLDISHRNPPKRHVIAARITAENPDAGFRPTSGSIQELNFRVSPQVWGYFSVFGRGAVHEFADSQFGHIFSSGSTRESARKHLVIALQDLTIYGAIRTTVQYLIKMLELEDYKENRIDTQWLDGLIATKMINTKEPDGPERFLAIVFGAVVKALAALKQLRTEAITALDYGRIPPPSLLCTTFPIELILDSTKFCLVVTCTGPNMFAVKLNDSIVYADARPLSDGRLLIFANGKTSTVFTDEDNTGLRLEIDNKTVVFEKENDPSKLRASTTGKLVRFLVEDGRRVEPGMAFAEMEVMKMYMQLSATHAGVLKHVANAESYVKAGDVIAVLDLDDKEGVTTAELFKGSFPPFLPPHLPGRRCHKKLREALQRAEAIMAGYTDPAMKEGDLHAAVMAQISSALHDPNLPYYQIQEAFNTVKAALPKHVIDEMEDIISSEQKLGSMTLQSDVASCSRLLLDKLAPYESDTRLQMLIQVLQSHASGHGFFVWQTLSPFLHKYLAVEGNFSGMLDAREEVIMKMLKAATIEAKSEQGLEARQQRQLACERVYEALLTSFSTSNAQCMRVLRDLEELRGQPYSKVALEARQLLVQIVTPSIEIRHEVMEQQLVQIVQEWGKSNDTDLVKGYKSFGHYLSPMVESVTSLFEELSAFIGTQYPREIRMAALELFIRRSHRQYTIASLCIFEEAATAGKEVMCAEMWFQRQSWLSSSSNRCVLANSHSDEDMSRRGEKSPSSQEPAQSSRRRAKPEECSQEGLDTLRCSPSPSKTFLSDDGPDSTQSDNGIDFNDPVHVLNLILCTSTRSCKDEQIQERVALLIQNHKILLLSLKISRVTLIILRPDGGYPAFHTFRDRLDYQEDLIYRHLNPPRAFIIEIGRLSVNYDVDHVLDGPVSNRHIRIYIATQKKNGESSRTDMKRFFVRSMVLGRVMADAEDSIAFLRHDLEQMIQESCESLALSKGYIERSTGKEVAYNRFGTLQMCNHMFLAVLPHLLLSRHEAIAVLQEVADRHFRRLRQVGVIEVEVTLTLMEQEHSAQGHMRGGGAGGGGAGGQEGPGMQPTRLRVVLVNPSGHKVQTNAYLEVFSSSQEIGISNYIFKSVPVDGRPAGGPLDGKQLSTPYPPIDQLELRRLMAKGKETTYCYDFITVFEKAVASMWEDYARAAHHEKMQAVSKSSTPDHKFEVTELVIRPPGLNDVAMVVWRVSVTTPECPKGREFILIVNDVTLQNGSFGVREDQVFHLATSLAQEEGIPRIFVAANTGARIGLVDEVRNKFRVQWKDPLNPSSGMEFLYLDEDTVDVLVKRGMAQVEEVTASDGTRRSKLAAVIGPDGIGVENLRGSGKIAGGTCRAYRDIFTLTFVSGTSVGIGAYLVRLGQRAIQKGPPILLTGEAALNKVLGKKVYTSNYQLGGTQIMWSNGVAHEVVSNDLMGVQAIMRWLSYVPARRGGGPCVLLSPSRKLLDPIERKVYDPRRGPDPQTVYDPRILLTGAVDAIGKWRGGLFDRDSFHESLDGWGMTTICGRARLGGIPVGVVLPEMRSVNCTHPADPADPDSKEQNVVQAGGVWFPDSAYKTATAIRDMNLEELPLFILANWRGFSGGMRDMYEEILKFGSMIVENLVDYSHPIFVLVPPGGELRGGAWVVIDPTINPEQMEMYVDPSARGGILEPSGIVEIKYRRNQLLETMSRLDPEVASLSMQLTTAPEHERRGIAMQLKARQELLLPLYLKVAEHFADLHDVPARMLAKRCVHGIVDWTWSRQFFYARLAVA
ncbi:hypothetical protein GUITHDRAFT_72035 [Guillardia theta CCMP2712]|uniref:Uncharacterized protein n=1 Tax=Guillardia theta (strain CCMP2712) TaxID=905079 RepID=L1J8C0_GUITC|nr:hypothetical protein GUITHDRAFT_72035 [Guillardia theta CCMP2712]EKX44597.1 hypothetical protein GUITHDRAFT_72035 [Guillardia theta CCMP2712]|eukprot:XP_005831577.1 hypothetical protein GUITHDRAFT_72035 [Guillardia theta CCMP2712]